MKITITTLKIPYVEAIKTIRNFDSSKTITMCQEFLTEKQNSTQILDKYSNEYILLEKIFNLTSEPYSHQEKNELIQEKHKAEKARKTLAAWRWIDDNVNDEGKKHIKFLIDNSYLIATA